MVLVFTMNLKNSAVAHVGLLSGFKLPPEMCSRIVEF